MVIVLKPEAERYITQMRDDLDSAVGQYRALMVVADDNACNWGGDSRETFNRRIHEFYDRCTELKRKSDKLFEDAEEFADRIGKATENYG